MNLSCREATRLLSQREDRSLSLAESAALSIHLTIFRGCRALGEQIPFLRRAAAKYFDSSG